MFYKKKETMDKSCIILNNSISKHMMSLYDVIVDFLLLLLVFLVFIVLCWWKTAHLISFVCLLVSSR